MPVGLVDDMGTVLYYEDSGVPDGSATYVTIVLVHGTMFHSGTYSPETAHDLPSYPPAKPSFDA